MTTPARTPALALGLVLLVATFGQPTLAHADTSSTGTSSSATASRFIVSYDEQQPGNATTTASAAQQDGYQVAHSRTLATGDSVLQLRQGLAGTELHEFMTQLADQPGVASVVPDQKLRVADTPDDTDYSQQWDLTDPMVGIDLPAALQYGDGRGITVGVVDNGITRHPDLAPVSGYDFVSDPAIARDGDGRDADPSDPGDWLEASDGCNPSGVLRRSTWHGTHTTGTIAALTGNHLGVAGVAGGAHVFMARALGRCGGWTSDVIDAMAWSGGLRVAGVPDNPHPADVVSMSLAGSGSCSPAFQNAVDALAARNVPVVVAAGNEDRDAWLDSPANCQGVITVGASGPDGARAYYSNFGSRVDVTAPGGNLRLGEQSGVLSTWNDGERGPGTPSYGWLQGTSMATPHVAGVVALMRAANPALTPQQVKQILQRTARPLPVPCPEGCGAGLVDANSAVQTAMATPGDGLHNT